MNKHSSYILICIAILLVLPSFTLAVENSECYGYLPDRPFPVGSSPLYPGYNGEPNQPSGELSPQERRNNQQLDIPAEECIRNFVGAKQIGDCSHLVNTNLAECENAYGGSSFSHTRSDQCLCYQEQVIVATNVFHYDQLCIDKAFSVIYDDYDYYCEPCTFEGVDGVAGNAEAQSGVWDEDHVAHNPCCGDDFYGPDKIKQLDTEWFEPAEDNFIYLGEICGAGASDDTCPNNGIDDEFTCPDGWSGRCVDVYPDPGTCISSTTCHDEPGCQWDYENNWWRGCEGCPDGQDYPLSDCGGCDVPGWNPPPQCCEVTEGQVYATREYTCSGQPTTDECHDDDVEEFTCTEPLSEPCIDIAGEEGDKQWRYVSCVQKQKDNPDSSELFCLNCMAGENRPPLAFDPNPRTWISDTYAVSEVQQCCGDDDTLDNFMMHGNLLCWKATTPSGHTYSDAYEDLVSSASSNNPPGEATQFYWTDPADIPYKVIKIEDSPDITDSHPLHYCCEGEWTVNTEGTNWFSSCTIGWYECGDTEGDDCDFQDVVTPTAGSTGCNSMLNIGNTVCCDEDWSYDGNSLTCDSGQYDCGEQGGDDCLTMDRVTCNNSFCSGCNSRLVWAENRNTVHDNVEFLAYEDQWHICWKGSFSHQPVPMDVNQMSVFDSGNPVDDLNVEGEYTSFYCSNAGFAGNNIASTHPQVYECGEGEVRGFDDNIIGGVPIDDTEMHYYSASGITGIEYDPRKFFLGSSEETEFPEFDSLDSMVYMDSNPICSNNGKCIVATSGQEVWDYTGFSLERWALGDAHHFNSAFTIGSINALCFIEDSFGVNQKYFGVLEGPQGPRYFEYDGTTDIESADTSDMLEDFFTECEVFDEGSLGPAPGEVRSIMAYEPPYGGVSYNTVVINTDTRRYYYEEHDGECYNYTHDIPEYGVDYQHSQDKMSSSATFVPEASTYIPPSTYREFNLPRYTGSRILYDGGSSKLYAQVSPGIYCTPRSWSTDLDNSQNYQQACEEYSTSEDTVHRWTGQHCCGEGEDAFEYYLDPYNGDIPYDYRVCYQGRGYSTGEHVFDYSINREAAGAPNLLRELLVKDNEILSCGVDHERTCEMQQGVAHQFGSCDMDRDMNKPYQGSGNLIKSGTNMQSEDEKGWRITGGSMLGETLQSRHWTSGCYQDSGECFMFVFSASEVPAVLSQPVFGLEPSTTYHLSAYIRYSLGENSDHQPITLSYKVLDGGSVVHEESRTFELTTSYERYNMIFTTPDSTLFEGQIHQVEFIVPSATGSEQRNIYLDNAKLSGNDYLLDLKDYPNPQAGEQYSNAPLLLGDTDSDYGVTYQFYCQTQDVAGDDGLPEYYCGFDEQFHEIGEVVEEIDGDEYDSERARAVDELKLKYINWSPEFGLVPESVQVAGCCFMDQCWTGKECVDPVNSGRPPLYPNQSVVDNAGSGFMCVLDEDTGMADWVNVSAKWYWDNTEHGYCVKESQCLVDWNGNISHNELPSNYSRIERANPPERRRNPICIDDGQFILDHYCDGGEWKTRTQIIAETMMQYPDADEDFSLYCGSHQDVLNVEGFDIHQVFPDFAPDHSSESGYCTGLLGDGYPEVRNVSSTYFMNKFYLDSFSQDEGCLIRDCMYRSHEGADFSEIAHPCINDVCVLHTASGETLIGFSHNREDDHLSGDHYPISNLFGYRKDQAFCDNVASGESDTFGECTPDNNDYEIYYNAAKQLVIFSKSGSGNPDSFSSGPGMGVESVAQIMRNHFWGIQDPMEGLLVYPTELDYAGNYSQFYYSQHDEGGTIKRVYGTATRSAGRTALDQEYEFSGIRTDMFVDFDGFSGLQICNSFDNRSDGEDYYCDVVSDHVRIASQGDSQNIYFNLYWDDLTAKLRLFR